jgi:hypothetical protein
MPIGIVLFEFRTCGLGRQPLAASASGQAPWLVLYCVCSTSSRRLSGSRIQETVRARACFTKEEDGLAREWYGRVWLNPPYVQPLIEQFVDKLIAELEAGRVKAAILLTHNYTDTTWFQNIAARADAICFTRGRVKFYELDGVVAEPTQGQTFSYFGSNVDRFFETFSEIGSVLFPGAAAPSEDTLPNFLRRPAP